MKLGTLITLVVCTFAATAAHAQSVSFGVKAGITGASVSTDGPGSFDAEAEVATAGGAFVAIPIAKRLRIQPELLVASRRFSLKNSPAGINVRSSGFEVPVLFQVMLTDTGRVRPMLYAGPQLSRISTVKQEVFEVESDISDRIKNVDFGVAVGGGIAMSTGRGAITIEARGTVGLIDVSEDQQPRIKSRSFMLLTGFRFR